MNLLQLIELCETKSGFNDTSFRTEWEHFLNEGVREFARRYPWPGLEDTLRVTATGTKYLQLPHFIDTICSILNESDGLTVERSNELERRGPSPFAQGTGGTPYYYDRIGTVPTTREPAGFLSCYSTSNSDNAASGVLLHVSGYAPLSGQSNTALGLVLKEELVTPNGTSGVTFTNNYLRIVSISRRTTPSGDFLIRDDTGPVGYIAVGDTESTFLRLQLMFVPPSGTNFLVRYRYKLPNLRNHTQSPPPAVDPDFVVNWALGQFWEHQQQFTKKQIKESRAVEIAYQSAHKEENFNESGSFMIPTIDDARIDANNSRF